MNFSITTSATWNYIKPMLLVIPFVVMILSGLFGTISAFERKCRKQFFSMNNRANSTTSFNFFRITFFLMLMAQCAILFSLVAVFIFILTNFELLCFGVFFVIKSFGFFALWGIAIISTFYFVAAFTKSRKPIFSRMIFVKFQQWFGLFATRTGFHIANYIPKLGICQ